MRIRFDRLNWLAVTANVLLLGIVSNQTLAQASRSDPEAAAPIDIWPIRDSLYLLVTAGSNITVSIGPSGILLVGTGREDQSTEVLAALERLDRRIASGNPVSRPIRYIVNTGIQPEYTGGNAALRSSALGTSSVIAHENALIRLVDMDSPFAMLPTETFGAGAYNLAAPFNGDSIRLEHVPAASTDGDAIVYFRGADVIATGAVFSMSAYPQIDVARGGTIDGLIDALNAILNIAVPGENGDGGTLIVPGHGRLADSADVGAYRDMLTIVRDHVQYLIDSGSTLDQVQAARPTLGYDPRFGSGNDSATIGAFVEAVYRSLAEARR